MLAQSTRFITATKYLTLLHKSRRHGCQNAHRCHLFQILMRWCDCRLGVRRQRRQELSERSVGRGRRCRRCGRRDRRCASCGIGNGSEALDNVSPLRLLLLRLLRPLLLLLLLLRLLLLLLLRLLLHLLTTLLRLLLLLLLLHPIHSFPHLPSRRVWRGVIAAAVLAVAAVTKDAPLLATALGVEHCVDMRVAGADASGVQGQPAVLRREPTKVAQVEFRQRWCLGTSGESNALLLSGRSLAAMCTARLGGGLLGSGRSLRGSLGGSCSLGCCLDRRCCVAVGSGLAAGGRRCISGDLGGLCIGSSLGGGSRVCGIGSRRRRRRFSCADDADSALGAAGREDIFCTYL